MRNLAIALLALAACGGKPKAADNVKPADHDLSHVGDPIPGKPTGTHAQLSCKGTSTVACQTPDYDFHGNYDTPSDCRWGGDGALNFTLRSSSDANATLFVHISNFNNAGVYQLDSDADYVELRASIPALAGACPRATFGATIRSHKYSCAGCQVTVTDPNPAAPYPKTLNLAVGCRSLCQENTYVCGPPINIQISQTCTR